MIKKYWSQHEEGIFSEDEADIRACAKEDGQSVIFRGIDKQLEWVSENDVGTLLEYASENMNLEDPDLRFGEIDAIELMKVINLEIVRQVGKAPVVVGGIEKVSL